LYIVDLPDSFFELSQFEMRLLISQQTKKQKELENMPLKTKAMREQEDEQKRKKYPKVINDCINIFAKSSFYNLI